MSISLYVGCSIFFISQLINNFQFIYETKLNTINNTFVNDDIETTSFSMNEYEIISVCNSIQFFCSFVIMAIICNMRHNIHYNIVIICTLFSLVFSITQIAIYQYNTTNGESSNMLEQMLYSYNQWTIINVGYLFIYNAINVLNHYVIRHYNKKINYNE